MWGNDDPLGQQQKPGRMPPEEPGQVPTRQPPQQPGLHETFLQRQQRLGRMPNSANRTMYPQASNLQQAAKGGSPYEGESLGVPPPGTGGIRPPIAGGTNLNPAPPPAPAPGPQPQMGPPAPPPPAQQAPAQTPATRYAGYNQNPNTAFAAIKARYEQRFGPNSFTQDKQTMLGQYAGYGGGNVTPEVWDKAMWAVEHFSGDLNNPGVPDYQSPAAGPQATPPGQNPPGQAGPQQPNPGGFNPTPGWGVPAPPPYQPDTAGLPEFQSTEFSQYEAPNQQGTTNNMQALLDQILLNPDTLGEQQVNQMKNRAKETALSQAQQLRGAAGQNLASRGFSGGGMEVAANRAVDNQLIADLINSGREIDLEAASTNRADRLNALGAGDSFLNNQLQRSTQGYAAKLTGQEAQAQDRRAGSDFGLRKWDAGEAAKRAANDSEFRNAQFQFDQMSEDRKQRLSEYLGVEAANLDRNKFAEMQSQFKTATGLDLLKFIENTRQFNASLNQNNQQFNASLGQQNQHFNQSLNQNQGQFNSTQGLNYAQLQQTGQQNLMNWLAQAYGV